MADFEKTDGNILARVTEETERAVRELLSLAGLRKGDLFVVGCSTSEILGGKIGKHSSPDTAEAVYLGVRRALQETGVFLAAQCCEHLNRALIVERAAAERYGYEIVAARPYPKAGGSFATAMWENAEDPVAVEHIRARAGIDIGGTLIGMHLSDVAVPVRLTQTHIGEAILLAARTRPKYIGGERTRYE